MSELGNPGDAIADEAGRGGETLRVGGLLARERRRISLGHHPPAPGRSGPAGGALAVADEEGRRLRYLIHLFAKEVVLKNFGSPMEEEILERMIEVLTYLGDGRAR